MLSLLLESPVTSGEWAIAYAWQGRIAVVLLSWCFIPFVHSQNRVGGELELWIP
jgi:hypothetical protein